MNKPEPSKDIKNPYLYNRKGHTPFDEMDSLDLLEMELQKEIEEETRERNTNDGC